VEQSSGSIEAIEIKIEGNMAHDCVGRVFTGSVDILSAWEIISGKGSAGEKSSMYLSGTRRESKECVEKPARGKDDRECDREAEGAVRVGSGNVAVGGESVTHDKRTHDKM
jgi:hypothetical protein